MATQYSILSILIRPEIQEKISIGLLLFDSEKIYFSYSKNKLELSKDLLSPSSYKILRDIIRNIENKISSDDSNYSEKRGFKIFKNKIFDNTFSPTYINYLSKYSNNIVSFSNPKEISIELTSDNFRILFKKYIDNIIEIKETAHKIKPIEVIKNRFGNKISEHYDIDKKITHGEVENLITPMRIDFIGSNGIDVYVQTVDMEAPIPSVSNEINSFLQLKSIYKNNNVPIQDFIISKEPPKTLKQQHDIWEQLRNSPLFNHLDLSESEAIIQYAEKHGVIPFSKKQS
jgi:hypothetical protein